MRPARGWSRGRSHSDPRIQTAENMKTQNAQSGQKGQAKGLPQWNQQYDQGDNYQAFESVEDRRYFIYRVYLILSCAVIFCALSIFLFTYFDETREFIDDHWWLYIVFAVAFMIIYIIFACVESARRTFPINLILFILMVICLAGSATVFSSNFSLMVIFYSFATTASITVLITIIARFIPIDFTKCGVLLCILSLIFCLISIVVTILTFVLHMPILQVGLAGLAVVFIVFWMLYDTQLILGGKYELDEDEYLFGAILLLVDIVYMYKYLLILFGYSVGNE